MHNEQNEKFSLCKLNELIRELDDGSEGAHLSSYRIELQAEEARESEQSPSVVLLCTSQLRRGMVCELERAMRECDDVFLPNLSGI